MHAPITYETELVQENKIAYAFLNSPLGNDKQNKKIEKNLEN